MKVLLTIVSTIFFSAILAVSGAFINAQSMTAKKDTAKPVSAPVIITEAALKDSNEVNRQRLLALEKRIVKDSIERADRIYLLNKQLSKANEQNKQLKRILQNIQESPDSLIVTKYIYITDYNQADTLIEGKGDDQPLPPIKKKTFLQKIGKIFK